MKTMTSMLLLGCMLVLAGFLSDVRPALGQSEGGCPVPEGVTPPPDPSVTASDVEADPNRSRLREFALVARDHFATASESVKSLDEVAYNGCRVRERGGPWYSGSIYVVTLTPGAAMGPGGMLIPEGRVLFHAKNMTLGGRKLDPVTYGSILQVVGLTPTGFANRDGGEFMTANASGYAAVYDSPNFGPLITLVGFELDESHLVDEVVAPDDPPDITASDVVDRRTLKAFVKGAADFLEALYGGGDLVPSTIIQKMRIALRDPNGPWRAGPVYLFVMNDEGYTIFHGAFPDKFELQVPTTTLRDAVTDELILPQIISAAMQNPDGGFVEYHFDNPDDDTDSAEIPKLTYALRRTTHFVRQGAPPIPLPFIIGAGIYGDPVSEESTVAAADWLARFGRAAASQAVDMIGGRLSSTSSGKSQLKIAGRTLNLDDYRPSDGQAAGFTASAHVPDFWDDAEGTFRSLSARDLLLGSSFQLSSMTGQSGMGGGAAIWGQAAHTAFDTGNNVSLDGSVTTGMLGADYTWGKVLAGLAVSHSIGDGGFELAADVKSEMESSLTSVHPYFRVTLAEGMSAWGLAGYGTGEMSLKEDDIDRQVETDITMTTGALGVRGDVLSASQTGFMDVAVKSDVLLMRIESDAKDGLAAISAEGNQVRLGVEGFRTIVMEAGGELRPSVELGMRYESGDAEQGTGFEVGGGVRYSNPGSGVSVEVRGRALVAGGGDDEYKDWGVGGSVRVRPGAMGKGFSLSLAPSWGVVSSGARSLWRQSSVALLTARGESADAGRLNAEMGYGLRMSGRALLTPYAGVTLLSEGGRDWRMGWRYNLGPSVRLNLEGIRREGIQDRDAPDHGVTLQGTVRW